MVTGLTFMDNFPARQVLPQLVSTCMNLHNSHNSSVREETGAQGG